MPSMPPTELSENESRCMHGKLGVLARYLSQVETLTLVILRTRVEKVDCLESRTNQAPLILANMLSDCGEA